MSTFCKVTSDHVRRHSIVAPAMASQPLPLLAPDIAGQHAVDTHRQVSGNIPSLGVYEFENAYAGACGTVWNDNREIYDSSDIILSQYARDEFERSINRADTANAIYRTKIGEQKIVRFDGDLVHVTRPGWQVYGHWLLDILPSLWLYKQFLQQNESGAINAKFLMPYGVPAWAWGIMDLVFGIKQEDCFFYNEADEIVRPNKIYLCSNLRIENSFSAYTNKMVNEIVEKCRNIKSQGDVSGEFKRVFVYRGSRYSFVPRSILNEEELVEIARTYGFVPIDPVSLPWPEQVCLFANASAVIGAFGSGMHNTIFSKSSTRSLILTNSQMNWIQSGISALRRQNMSYVWPSREENQSAVASMVYDADVFKKALVHMI